MELFSRESAGPETGRGTMVILHGMLGSSRNWATAAADFAAAGYRVFALDLRNHGASPHAAEMDYTVMARDVEAWLQARGMKAVTLVGHSMGGKVAMQLACRRPDLVGRLVVVDIAPKDYRWVGHRLEFEAMHALDLEHLGSRAEAEMRMEGRVPELGMRKFLTTNLERRPEGKGWRWSIDLEAITAALPALEKNPLRAEDRYEGPALFVIGGKSRYVDPERDWPGVLAHFPKARLVVIPQSGHNPHFDARGDFVGAVLRE